MIMTTFMITCVNAGSAKLAVAVEHAGEQRSQRDEEQVRERPAQHLDGEIDTCRARRASSARTQDDERRGDHADAVTTNSTDAEGARDAVHELAHIVLRALHLYSAMTGTKACENAPSANRRRRKFGILKATRKASMNGAGAEGLRDRPCRGPGR